MKKRMLSMLLAIVMVVGLLPATALAVETVATGYCNNTGEEKNGIAIWELSTDGTLMIKKSPSGGTGMGTFSTVDANRPSWETYKTQIKKVIIENDITSLGSYAFYNYTALEEVVIGNGIQTIKALGFYGCTKLTKVTIGSSVREIQSSAFNGCTSLANVMLPSGVTTIGAYAFASCPMTEIIIPASVTTIENLAFDGTKLTKVTYLGTTDPGADSSSVFPRINSAYPTINVPANYIGTTFCKCTVTKAEATTDINAIVVSATPAEGGSVAVTVDGEPTDKAEKGSVVTITVTENNGYVLKSLAVADADDENIVLTKNSDTYTFTMPEKAVVVTAVFKEDSSLVYVGGTLLTVGDYYKCANNTLTSDGTADDYNAYLTFNEATGYTLNIKDLTVSGVQNTNYGAGIYSANDDIALTINFSGTNIINGAENETNAAIYSLGDLNITGSGTLTAKGSTASSGNIKQSSGIAVVEGKSISITNANEVYANAGYANYSPGLSQGLRASNILIENSIVYAKGGQSFSQSGFSEGIAVVSGALRIEGTGTKVEAVSGDEGYNKNGISGNGGINTLYLESGLLRAESKDATEYSSGITGITLNMTGGVFEAVCGTATSATPIANPPTIAEELSIYDSENNIINYTNNYTIFKNYSFVRIAPSHIHDWGYSASGAVITATCNNSNCGITTDPTLTLSVAMTDNAPVVSVTPNATWTTENSLTVLTASDVKYVDSSSVESTDVPTAAGAYTAKLTVNGKVASVDFEILDYTGIDTAISSVPVDMSNYTDETVSAVNAAKTVAETAKSSATTQAELDSAATALTNAIAALAFKPADYTAVDAALAKVPNDPSVYTAETNAALEAAVAAVVRGKDITEQATVTGYATAIENAVAALITELRSAEIAVTVPAKGATPTTSAANGTGYTVGTLSWNGSPEVFLGSTEYTVTFTLTAADKHVFASNAAITVPGAKDDGVSAEVASDGKTVSVTATFPATLAKGVTSIVIETMPTNTDYTYGDTFDPKGLVLTVSYDDSSVEDVTYNDETKAAFSFGSELNVATTAVAVTYGGKSASIAVTIAPKALTITVADKSAYAGNKAPDLSKAEAGKDYTVDGLVDGDSITVALSYVTEPVMNKSGEYEITATASDSNYVITVVNGKLTVSYYPVYPDPTYPPVVDGGNNGDVSVSPKNPEKGDKVTIIAEPDKGYEVGEITVTDSKGNEVEVIDNGDGTYTYVQPVGKVTITVSYVPAGSPSEDYSDLSPDAWYIDAVDYVLRKGLMNGVGGDKFDPDGTTSRAMIVTMLWRLEGEPVVNYLMQFEDVAAETWYTEAVRWAASEKIVEGWDGKFDPMGDISREQFVTILWRYAKYKGYDVSVGENTNILSYEDAFSVSEYAIPAMQWACGAGLMQGDGVNLTPKADATRAQAAALFQRFCENVAEK